MIFLGNEQGVDEDVVPFIEISGKGNPMGRYRNLSVFAAEGYRDAIKQGKAYYCKLTRGNGQFYNAVPLFELSLDKIMEESPEMMERIVSFLYQSNPSLFDSKISATQIADIRRDAEKKYVEKIRFLEKDNERLKYEMKEMERRQYLPQQGTGDVVEGIRDDLYYSNRLEECYYSVRINVRNDRILLVKDDNGAYGGHGKSIAIEPFKKILNAKEIKGEYCEKYGGIVFTKRD